MKSRTLPAGAVPALVLCAVTASAQPAPAPPAPAPPYSLPWLLRPATPSSVMRLDETLAFYEDPASGTGGASYLTGLIATRKLGSHWVPIFREFFVHNDAPSGASTPSGGGFSNPLLGVTYYRPLGGAWRFSGFFSSTIPIGSGGGDDPDRGAEAAMTAALSARSAMDNALFAVNYWTVIGGLGLARISPGARSRLRSRSSSSPGPAARAPRTRAART